MTSYPCTLDLERPQRFERSHVFLRILALMALGVFGVPLGALFVLLYLLLPVVAAAEISARSDRYLTQFAPKLIDGLQLIADALAYLMLLTDRVPRLRTQTVHLAVSPEGEPTVSSALLRALYALPEAFVIALLGVVSSLFWMISAVWILATGMYPSVFFTFQLAMLRLVTRLLVYLASLVDRYPPLILDTRHEADGALSARP